MKKVTLILFAILFAVTGILAQAPNMFKYQAVLHNADGTIIAEESVTVDIAILQGSASGDEVFTESHTVTTTAQGLINLNIGSVEDLSVVDWGADNYFVEITVNDILMGTSQLLSVPYALLSNAAKTSADWTADMDTLYSAVDSTLVIKNGKIGVGTETPNTKLEVTGEITSIHPNSYRQIWGDYAAFFTNDGDAFYILSTNSGDQYGSFNDYRHFRFHFETGDVMIGQSIYTTRSNFHVGIGLGNNSPSESLDVNGAVKISSGGYSGITDGATTPVPAGGAGTMIFLNTHFYGWNGSAWKQLDN